MSKKPPEEPEQVEHYERDIVWAAPGGRDIHVDVSRPDGEGPFPMLVWFHGGAWKQGRKENSEGQARYTTNRGYVVVNANYRMRPEVTMKEMIEDAMGAVIWAKDHAESFRGDGERLAVGGHSSGGQLAAMVGVANSEPFFEPTYKSVSGNDYSVGCLVPVSGVFDFKPMIKTHGKKWLPEIFGATPAEASDLYEKSSPAHYLTADLPPQLVVCGGKEHLQIASREWAESVRRAGAKAELYVQAGQRHFWLLKYWTLPTKQTYDRIIRFLDNHLKSDGRGQSRDS
jgi:acetyl esterase/lipase